MLKVGSVLYINDNSGALSMKILSFKSRKNVLATYVTVSDVIFGVIQDFDIHRKRPLLKKKAKISALIVTVTKKYSKHNSMHIRFSKNMCIPLKITRFITPIASKCFLPVFYELKFSKKYKLVYKNATASY